METLRGRSYGYQWSKLHIVTARYMLHLVEPLFLRLTQDNLTDHIDIKMRTLSLSWACSMGRWGISSAPLVVP